MFVVQTSSDLSYSHKYTAQCESTRIIQLHLVWNHLSLSNRCQIPDILDPNTFSHHDQEACLVYSVQLTDTRQNGDRQTDKQTDIAISLHLKLPENQLSLTDTASAAAVWSTSPRTNLKFFECSRLKPFIHSFIACRTVHRLQTKQHEKINVKCSIGQCH